MRVKRGRPCAEISRVQEKNVADPVKVKGLTLTFRRLGKTKKENWKCMAQPLGDGWPETDTLGIEALVRGKLHGWPTGEVVVMIQEKKQGIDATEVLEKIKRQLALKLTALLPHSVRSLSWEKSLSGLPRGWEVRIVWHSTRSEKSSNGLNRNGHQLGPRISVQLPKVPQETKDDLERCIATYLDRFGEAREKLRAIAALTKTCKGALRNQLTPVLRQVLANAPEDFGELRLLATEVNAVLGDLDAAVIHPFPKEHKATIPGNLYVARAQPPSEEKGYLYVQVKSRKYLSIVDKRTAAISPKTEDGRSPNEFSPVNLALMESAREEPRSLRETLLGW